eukprot:TRINITY_DN6182_c0_g1_i1.p1 TRINITY_DN6182_c0_g1~~TRINITY_DN6182_c0_g1_i1.p1  ORF type:complete len:798 (+),score=103.87 TRINITY_DN6182_c0_g1_i1:52-2394(+)
MKFIDFLSPKNDVAQMKLSDSLFNLPAPDVFPDWTQKFHDVLKCPPETRSTELRNLINHFVETAKRFGQLIIKERNLPNEHKTVKPISGCGFAGGEKFKVANIFFKFAIDHNNLFPNDQCAMKVAGHELKGLTAVVSCGMILGLSFPLLALIDYRGFRLVATSVLPISKKTIVYGSCDGGVDVHTDVEEMNNLMKKIAKILNLKGHMSGIGPVKKFLYGPCDIEGHQADDGKRYIIDTSRIWPCEKPNKNIKGSFMFRLLRGEFVSKYPIPLSSDAFSFFGKHDCATHNHEVTKATQYLLQHTIPEFAKRLEEPNAHRITSSTQFLAMLHRAGINIRHLGRVRSHIKSRYLRELILREICARYIKNVLRCEMRKITTNDEDTFRRMIVDFFNLVFGSKKGSHVYWLILKQGASAQYRFCLNQDEAQRSTDLRVSIDMPLLFRRLQNLTGIIFRSSADPLSRPLTLNDFVQMEVKEKHMYAIPRIEADSLAEVARTKTGKKALELYCLSKEKYKTALELKPDDYGVLQNLGTVTADIAKLKFNVEGDYDCSSLYAEAYEHFACSLRINANDYKALNRWGNALCENADILLEQDLPVEANTLYGEAYKKYERANSICPCERSILYNWGNQLRNSAKVKLMIQSLAHLAEHDLVEAIAKYKACTQLTEDDTVLTVDAHINWGCALIKLGELKNDAKYFAQARSQFLKSSALAKFGGISKDEATIANILSLADRNLQYLSEKTTGSPFPVREAHLPRFSSQTSFTPNPFGSMNAGGDMYSGMQQ